MIEAWELRSKHGVFTRTGIGNGTGTETGTGTVIMQKPFTLAVSGTRTGHLKVIEISLKHTTWNSFRT